MLTVYALCPFSFAYTHLSLIYLSILLCFTLCRNMEIDGAEGMGNDPCVPQQIADGDWRRTSESFIVERLYAVIDLLRRNEDS